MKLINKKINRLIEKVNREEKRTITSKYRGTIEIFNEILEDKGLIELCKKHGVELNEAMIYRVHKTVWNTIHDSLANGCEKVYLPQFGRFVNRDKLAKSRFGKNKQNGGK